MRRTKINPLFIITIIIGLFILFVISIPFIEISRNEKYLEPYPEIKQDTMKFDSEKLRKALVTKRIVELDVNLDVVEKASGISKATLSRLENNKPPDIFTFGKVCKWLAMNPNEFFK